MSSSKKCYICSMKIVTQGGTLLDVSGYSEKTLMQVLEIAVSSTFDLTNSTLCDRCVNTLECYDKFLTKAQSIQEKLKKFMNSKLEPEVMCIIDDDDNDVKIKDEKDVKPSTSPKKRHPNDLGCTICGKKMPSKEVLRKHTRLHELWANSQEKVICEKCGETVRGSRYQIHQRECTGSGPFKCEVCNDKVYERYDQLRKHLSWHKGRDRREAKGRVECDYCGKKIYPGAKMVRHMMIHTNPKAYGCVICASRFNNKDNMVGHMKTYHEACHPSRGVFICGFCGPSETFKRVDVFRQHYETVHGVFNNPLSQR